MSTTLSINEPISDKNHCTESTTVGLSENEEKLLARLKLGDLKVLEYLHKKALPVVYQEIGLQKQATEILSDVLIELRRDIMNDQLVVIGNTSLLEHIAACCRKRWENKQAELSIESKIIQSLLQNDGWAFYYIQKAWFPSVSYYIRTCGGTVDDAKDIIMDAILALVQNIQEGRYQLKPDVKLKTYFIQICRNKWKDHLKKYARVKAIGLSLWEIDNEFIEMAADAPDELLSERQKVVVSIFQKVTDTCKKVLSYFYYDNLSHEEIASRMGYNNANTSKTQKMKCLRKLRSAVMNYVGKICR
jgi:RNA polymerase sigma factor (sigma-70 family)